ncbi:MAG: hypothetical protein CMO74_15680 [Verrucomicrobiales bacterium]|nr:hypothetical protein [Verrucomicrobiales bacterium]|tara:strand:+ start:44208 stop:46694 length:2487 start_codon:yes stop_codon:yes gene_type:complete
MLDQFINLNVLKYGWPLALLPVLIHLFNRLRHRRIDWAAMMFLRIASRKSTRFNKIRQYLVLALRVLAVLALILALSRPLAGTWLGGMMTGDPETILIVLDRSVSMDSKDGSSLSKREAALARISDTANKFPGAEIWYLDSVVGTPERVDRLEPLESQFDFNATDTAVNMPRLLEQASDWLGKNRSGDCMVFIASDMQEDNWRPEASGRWAKVAEGLSGDEHPFKASVQVLAKTRAVTNNVSLRVLEARRGDPRTAPEELNLVVQFHTSSKAEKTLNLLYHLNGTNVPPSNIAVKHQRVKVKGSTLPINVSFKAPTGTPEIGWGFVQIGLGTDAEDPFAVDDNPRDNRAYFVYGPSPELAQSAIIGPGPEAATDNIRRAADPFYDGGTNRLAHVLAPGDLNATAFAKYATVAWQDPLPEGPVSEQLMRYVSEGGVLIFFPPSETNQVSGRSFAGMEWQAVQAATNGAGQALANWRAARPANDDEQPGGYRVAGWREREGPLANSQNNLTLPVRDLITVRRNMLRDHGVEAFNAMELAWEKAEALRAQETPDGALIREMQKALETTAEHLSRLGSTLWPGTRATDFKAQLVDPVKSLDATQPGEARRELVDEIWPFLERWRGQVDVFEGGHYVMARFSDDRPLLARKLVGRGQVYFCATRPDEAWSSLHEQWFFVVMMDRLIRTGEALGAGSYSVSHTRVCGTFEPPENSTWKVVSSEVETADYRRNAGVYQSEMGEFIALNRPMTEDDWQFFAEEQEDLVQGLFGGVPVHVHWETGAAGEASATDGPKEVWDWFLIIMAVVLLGEALLVIPRSSDEAVAGRRTAAAAT